ncbi:hypothetical protein CSKR_109144 [Clonorchis sinensis]|uniref:Uncharacterized protein n=1 Tax=Clonorchis sinensis TaxID=79923 RepID=A0A3R7GPM5_CLOSI|nr:hypothetical protein CSKR_109144 [Clonorchis sinensis]
MPPEGSTIAEILPGCPSLQGESRGRGRVRTTDLPSRDTRELTNLKVRVPNPVPAYRILVSGFGQPGSIPALVHHSAGPKWLKRKVTDRKVRVSNPTSASRLPLSRLGQPGSIPALVFPSGGMAARHRKGDTAERFSVPKADQFPETSSNSRYLPCAPHVVSQ